MDSPYQFPIMSISRHGTGSDVTTVWSEEDQHAKRFEDQGICRLLHNVAKKEGRNWVLRTSLSTAWVISQRETNPEPGRSSILLRIVPRGISVEGGPWTALHNAAHLYSDQAIPLGDPALWTH